MQPLRKRGIASLAHPAVIKQRPQQELHGELGKSLRVVRVRLIVWNVSEPVECSP
jgi:hypothetical protein